MDYQKLKEKFLGYKKEAILGACFLLVFLVGFGVGHYDKYRLAGNRLQSNYTIKTPEKIGQEADLPKPEPAAQTPAKPQVAGESTTLTSTPKSVPAVPTRENCKIKGNISSSKKKIYHMANGAFYDRTNPEECFDTEAEAKAAGYVRSSR